MGHQGADGTVSLVCDHFFWQLQIYRSNITTQKHPLKVDKLTVFSHMTVHHFLMRQDCNFDVFRCNTVAYSYR